MSWTATLKTKLGTLDLDVELLGDDRAIALIGPNGSGKSTALRSIAGVGNPDEGRVSVGARVLFDSDASIDEPPEARRIGYVPQGLGLFPHLRAVDNVAFGLGPSTGHTRRAERRRAAFGMLRSLDAAHLGHRLPATLSGGEQQRVALARALIVEPQLLLLDEPLSALDATVRRSLRGFLADRVRERGIPTILVTHDVRDVAAFGARAFVLERGKVVQVGSVSELRADPATDFVAEFVGLDLVDAGAASPTP